MHVAIGIPAVGTWCDLVCTTRCAHAKVAPRRFSERDFGRRSRRSTPPRPPYPAAFGAQVVGVCSCLEKIHKNAGKHKHTEMSPHRAESDCPAAGYSTGADRQALAQHQIVCAGIIPMLSCRNALTCGQLSCTQLSRHAERHSSFESVETSLPAHAILSKYI